MDAAREEETEPAAQQHDVFVAARAGDAEAWRQLVERFAPLVYAVPRRMGLCDADADEVVQSTWSALHRHMPLIDKPRSLSSWILTTAAREAGRILARESRRRDVEALGGAREREVADPHDVTEELERAEAVREALEGLRDPCRTLLHALYLDPARSYQDIADALGMPLGSVGPTRIRCLAKLARVLEGRWK